jgi:hypothetical protein
MLLSMPGISSLRRLGRTLVGLARAALVLASTFGVAFYVSLRSAEARAGEALLGFGSELLRWEGLRAHTRPRGLTVNGLELGLVAVSTELGVRETLDRFHALCTRRGAISPEAILGEARATDISERALGGVFRQESADEGVLACLDTAGPLELGELVRRLAKFTETGDLGAVGELRYVLARWDGEGTTALIVWTEGRADVLGMFPKGDAPGRDPAGIARPTGSRRLLSAAEHGAPYAVTVYDADGRSAGDVIEEYVSGLSARGWSVQRLDGAGSLIGRQGARTIVVRVAGTSRNKTLATVVELDSPRARD